VFCITFFHDGVFVRWEVCKEWLGVLFAIILTWVSVLGLRCLLMVGLLMFVKIVIEMLIGGLIFIELLADLGRVFFDAPRIHA
jgi:hypothetical protein